MIRDQNILESTAEQRLELLKLAIKSVISVLGDKKTLEHVFQSEVQSYYEKYMEIAYLK